MAAKKNITGISIDDEATAGSIVQRDAAGAIRVADATDPLHAMNKQTIDALLASDVFTEANSVSINSSLVFFPPYISGDLIGIPYGTSASFQGVIYSLDGGETWARRVLTSAITLGTSLVSLWMQDENTMAISYLPDSPVAALATTTNGWSTHTATTKAFSSTLSQSVPTSAYATKCVSATKAMWAYSSTSSNRRRFERTSDGLATWDVSFFISTGTSTIFDTVDGDNIHFWHKEGGTTMTYRFSSDGGATFDNDRTFTTALVGASRVVATSALESYMYDGSTHTAIAHTSDAGVTIQDIEMTLPTPVPGFEQSYNIKFMHLMPGGKVLVAQTPGGLPSWRFFVLENGAISAQYKAHLVGNSTLTNPLEYAIMNDSEDRVLAMLKPTNGQYLVEMVR